MKKNNDNMLFPTPSNYMYKNPNINPSYNQKSMTYKQKLAELKAKDEYNKYRKERLQQRIQLVKTGAQKTKGFIQKLFEKKKKESIYN